MKNILIYILLFLAPFFVSAERINNNTEVYSQPGKSTVAQLYKGSGIYVAEQDANWTKIIAVVNAPIKNFDDNILELKRGSGLYDALGQETGRVYSNLKLPAQYSYTDDYVIFELVGYIRTSLLDTNWVAERRLVHIIDSAKSKVRFEDVLPEIQKFGFFNKTEDSGFTAFVLNDIAGLDYKNPIQRLKLVFYENRLVAIFHKNPIKLNSKEAIVIDGKENLIYLRDLNATEKRIFGLLFLEG